jgi:hypothetical protein
VTAEKEALEYATEVFRLGYSVASRLTRANLVAFDMIECLPPNDRDAAIDTQVSRALFRGDADAVEVLRVLSARRISTGVDLSAPLRLFVEYFLLEPHTKWRVDGEGNMVRVGKIKSKPGPAQGINTGRDYMIWMAIAGIVLRWGLPATRNPASREAARRASAASIVRDALEKGANIHMGEDAVNKIWGNFHTTRGQDSAEIVHRAFLGPGPPSGQDPVG